MAPPADLLDITWDDGPADGTIDLPDCPRCATRPDSQPLAELERPLVSSPDKAAELIVPQLANADREHCLLLPLDTKYRLIGQPVTVSVGSVDHTFMIPREVYRDALAANAASIIVAHNHPSGDPDPSADDEAITRRLVKAGDVVGVELLDHLIVGGRRWTSLARRGIV